MSREIILIVDDNKDFCQSVMDIIRLESGYYQTLVAYDGKDALDMIHQQPPDLILLDLQMPKMGGLDVLKRLKADHLSLPVILMTAHGSEAIAVEVFRLGVKDYIIKGKTTDAEIVAAVEHSLTEVRLRKEKEALNAQLVAKNFDLRRRLRELRILSSIGRSVTALMDMDDLMCRMVGAATILTESEEGAIFVLKQGNLICKGRKQHQDERPKVTNVVLDEPLAIQAIETNQLVLAPRRIPGQSSNGALPFQSAIAVPLTIAGQPVGALVVKNVSPGTAHFDEHHGELVSALADYAAIAYQAQGQIQEEDRATLIEALHPSVIFVSYCHEDWGTFVQPVVERLIQWGFDVWIDQDRLMIGVNWQDTINQALDGCAILVLCVTPAALASRYVRQEYRYFLHHNKPIIPIVCREARLPAELLGIQSLHYNETSKLYELLKLILHKPGRP